MYACSRIYACWRGVLDFFLTVILYESVCRVSLLIACCLLHVRVCRKGTCKIHRHMPCLLPVSGRRVSISEWVSRQLVQVCRARVEVKVNVWCHRRLRWESVAQRQRLGPGKAGVRYMN
ncbi:hypothetical protein E2C01_082622 [Portunus trituberculatus]|uniref:Uncharacterized protein n=1 Tax=Portunus trituberculatus TaxID=210409 RepID=A0A5B7IZM0_PORTR|nr:hypothetical protein [Portunus trituberculatus]